MRATVLCILAIAGATCALQIPSIPSPQSALDAGSSILGNIPGVNRGDDSSSSSSEEDQNPSDIAVELAERLVNDITNAAGGIGSVALLPLNIGSAIFDSITKEISNFLGDVLHPDNSDPNAPTVPELANQLARSVVHVVAKLGKNIGSVLLEPVKLKAQLVESIAHEVDKVIQNVQTEGSGQHHHPQPNDRPHQRPQPGNSHHRPTSQRPKPTRPSRPPTEKPRPTRPSRPPTERPRPTRPSRPPTERPRPTHPNRPSTERPRTTTPSQSTTERPSTTTSSQRTTEQPNTTPSEGTTSPQLTTEDDSANGRVARDVGLNLSGSINFNVDQVLSDGKIRNLGSALAIVDFSQVVKPIPKISDLTPLNKLSPAVASITKRARDLVIHAIAAGAPSIEDAIQYALSAAIHNVSPAVSIVNLVNIVLQIYVFVAENALTAAPVAAALLKEAAIVGGSIVSSLLATIPDAIADEVRALLN